MNKDDSKYKDLIKAIDTLPITGFLDAFNIPFIEQIGNIRYYESNAFHTLAINVKRNQWINQDTGKTGSLNSLLKAFSPKPMMMYDDILNRMLLFYKEHINEAPFFPTVPIRHGMANTMIVNSNDAFGKIAKFGLSLVTLSNYCNEILIKDKDTGNEDIQLAFPCDNREFYLFNGSTLRPLDEPSITTFGTKCKGQNCYVYENALDFLAMSEIQHRNRADYFHKKDYHLIINGKQNLKQACQFIHDNPDFQDILSFMPANEDGKEIYKELNKACDGTIIDGSRLYDGHPSLIGKIQFHVPMWFVKEYKKKEKEERVMNQGLKRKTSINDLSGTQIEAKTREHIYGPSQTIKLEGKDRRKNIKGLARS